MFFVRIVIAFLAFMLSMAAPPLLLLTLPWLIFECLRLVRFIRDARNPDAAYIRQLERDLRNDRDR